MNYEEESLKIHEQDKGKMELVPKRRITNIDELSVLYTPGVAEPSRKIAENKEDVYKYTMKGNAIAIVTDGSAVLGLGNIGPEAALPVMEGKSLLFKQFANIDAFPICVKTQDADEIAMIVRNISPAFGAINLEDISAPRCFEVEEKLADLGIPVFHDDQHGTAIITLAALINAAKLSDRKLGELEIAINGAGAAGTAITKLLKNEKLREFGLEPVKEIILCDSKGIIYSGREGLNKYKQEIAEFTNTKNLQSTLADAMLNKDVFIGVSKANLVDEEMIKSMNENPIVFAMANPIPEIMPEKARHAGAKIIATGRSDYANQANNVLAFPGVLRGALDARATKITEEMKIAAAIALADYVENPSVEMFIPNPLDEKVAYLVAERVAETWRRFNE
ncbi:MAG: NADP-dependent malic enzyme [Candidatus Diapherotrites archaeon]